MKRILLLAIILIIPAIVFAQDTTKKKAYYFYGETCPHCQKVDEYFKANGIYDKYDITKLEFSNPFNTRLLLKFEDAFNSPSKGKGSVPAIAFDGQFIEGDAPIIENFQNKIEAADASELPDPDKINQNQPNSSQNKASDVPAAGNKKNLFPVLLVALIVIGGGALVYINRKKSN